MFLFPSVSFNGDGTHHDNTASMMSWRMNMERRSDSDTGKPKYRDINLPPCQFVHRRSHMRINIY